jgi:hypothetical protein
MILSRLFDSRRTRTSATRTLFCAFLLFCLAMPEALSAATFKLTVRKLGDGSGTVFGNGGVLCDPGCTTTIPPINLPQGSSVTVTGSAAEGSVFLGFMGDRCFGPEQCTFTMSSDITLYASFGPPDRLGIRYSSPSNGDTGVAVSSQPTIFFNRDIAAGPNLANVTLLDSAQTAVPFTPVVGSTDRRLVLVTPASFAPGATYMVQVPAGAVSDTQGNSLLLDEPYVFTFTTANSIEPKMYISAYPPHVMEGSQAKISIWFETPSPEERTITLTSTPPGELFHPSEVFLPAGEVLAEVQVGSRYNHGSTSPTTVTVSAAEPGVGQRSTHIVVANNTSVTGASLKWQAGSVVSDTDHDGVFEAGEIADIRFEVANFGTSSINNVTLDFSVNNSYGIHILGGEPFRCNLGSLAAGRSANCTRSFRADSDLPTADYFIQVQGTSSQNGFVDQARIHIVNNSQPDFVLIAGSFPSGELLPDSTVTLRYTARNNGDGFSEQLPLFEVTMDSQGTPVLLYQTYADVRGYIWNEQSFRLPLRVPLVPGTYTIRARINPPSAPSPPGRLTESNYANNDATVLTLRVAVANQLTVTTQGSGTGTVTSIPGGIDCGTDCSSYYAASAAVTLTASPAEGSVFTGWAGAGCSGTGSCMVTMDAARSVTATFEPAGPPSFDFYTVTPCRLLDTRSSTALVSQVPRLIPVAGLCGVPSTARSVVLNITVVTPTGPGHISLWPADLPSPPTSVINFSGGQTRGNNAIVGLATDGGGDLAANAVIGGSGAVHLILDVSGYFQ